MPTESTGTRGRGFASMTADKQREIARKGGRAAHERGTAHEFTTDEARAAGRKGGEAVSANRSHMAEIGRLGGRRSAGRRSTANAGNGTNGHSPANQENAPALMRNPRPICSEAIVKSISPSNRRWILIAEIVGIALLCASLLLTDVRRIGTKTTGDFVHFFYAADAVRRGKDPYAAWTRGYIYPPLIAFLFQPLSPLGRDHAAAFMLMINVVVTLLAVGLAADEFLRRFNALRYSIVIALVMLMAMLLNIDKLKGEWQMWQTDVFMLLLFVLSLRWLDRRPILAGVALGIAVNIKYLPLMFIPYLVIRRRWTVTASLVVSTVIFAMLPAISSGWNANLRNWGTATNGLLQMADLRGKATDAAEVHDVKDSLSCSITSAMARAARSNASLGFALAALVALTSLGIAALMYHHRNRSLFRIHRHEMLTGIEWVMLVAAVLAFGPQTNTRHLFDALILTTAASVFLLFHKNQLVLTIGIAILFLGFVLPPGNRTVIGEHTPTTVWLRLGGPCWCLLISAFSLLWTALREIPSR